MLWIFSIIINIINMNNNLFIIRIFIYLINVTIGHRSEFCAFILYSWINLFISLFLMHLSINSFSHLFIHISIVNFLKPISIWSGMFLCLGCSGVVPSIHLTISLGFLRGVEQGALGWLVLMGALYIIGALMYAFRVPERFFPGKCNFWVCNKTDSYFNDLCSSLEVHGDNC